MAMSAGVEDDMRGIGEVAKASGLTISALRFYDAAGVLVPAAVDAATGYRRYTDEQVRTARLVGGWACRSWTSRRRCGTCPIPPRFGGGWTGTWRDWRPDWPTPSVSGSRFSVLMPVRH